MIENKIYDIIEDYECGIDIYSWGADDKVAEYLASANIEFTHLFSMWPNEQGGCAMFAWIENNRLHSICFNIIKEV